MTEIWLRNGTLLRVKWIAYDQWFLYLSDLELVGSEKQYFYKSAMGFPGKTHNAWHMGHAYTKKLVIVYLISI